MVLVFSVGTRMRPTRRVMFSICTLRSRVSRTLFSLLEATRRTNQFIPSARSGSSGRSTSPRSLGRPSSGPAPPAAGGPPDGPPEGAAEAGGSCLSLITVFPTRVSAGRRAPPRSVQDADQPEERGEGVVHGEQARRNDDRRADHHVGRGDDVAPGGPVHLLHL